MRVFLIVICVLANGAAAQLKTTKATPEVKTLTVEEGTVTTVYLSPGYTTSVRLPEEVSSVVVGNPASFKAEHAESEPRLVFLKPITAKPSESNALITTKSGQEISLHLISSGQVTAQSRVDFLLEYRHPQSAVIHEDANRSFFISETKSVSSGTSTPKGVVKSQGDPITEALAQQQTVSTPQWEGDGFEAALGESTKLEEQTILRFSVLNHTKRTIELMPPQVQLSGATTSGKKKKIKAEPVGIADCRMTTRRLAPGERADGVVVFERPAFKESSERLELKLAEADQVDQPLVLSVPFTSTRVGGGQ